MREVWAMKLKQLMRSFCKNRTRITPQGILVTAIATGDTMGAEVTEAHTEVITEVISTITTSSLSSTSQGISLSRSIRSVTGFEHLCS